MEEDGMVEAAVFGSGKWKILMAESGFDMFFMRLALGLLNVCTFMLAVPWTKTMYYTKWASKVEIDGKNLRFTGNAGSFFGVWLKTLALSTVTLSLYYWFIGRKNVARWVDSNIEWA